MARNPFKPKSPVEQLEAEIAFYQERIEALSHAAEKAKADVRTEVEARVALLMDKGAAPDSPEVAKATDKLRQAESLGEGVNDALDRMRSRLADKEALLASLRDQGNRAAIADRAEQRAARIETLAAEAEKHFTAGAAVMDRLAACVRRDGLLIDDPLEPTPGYAAIASAVCRQIAPESPEMRALFGMPALPIGALAAALRFQVEPLRGWAARIRNGTAPADELGRRVITVPVHFQDTSIVLREGIKYQGVDGLWIEIMVGGVCIPEPVAAAAVKLGIGFEPASLMGAKIIAELKRPPAPASAKKIGNRVAEDGAPIVDRSLRFRNVGVNLFDLVQAERTRLGEQAA